MEKFVELGEKFGLEGAELLAFVIFHAKTFLTISVQTAEHTACKRIRNG